MTIQSICCLIFRSAYLLDSIAKFPVVRKHIEERACPVKRMTTTNVVFNAVARFSVCMCLCQGKISTHKHIRENVIEFVYILVFTVKAPNNEISRGPNCVTQIEHDRFLPCNSFSYPRKFSN